MRILLSAEGVLRHILPAGGPGEALDPSLPSLLGNPQGNLVSPPTLFHPLSTLQPAASSKSPTCRAVHFAHKLALVLHCPQGNTQTCYWDSQAQPPTYLPLSGFSVTSPLTPLWLYCHLWAPI